MTLAVLGMVLLGALLHASWNLLVKAADDTLLATAADSRHGKPAEAAEREQDNDQSKHAAERELARTRTSWAIPWRRCHVGALLAHVR